jgi:hypothetical protein
MAPQIGQHGARAVGSAHQVERTVSEGVAHLLDIVHRGVRGVPGEIHLLLQAIPAGADLVGRQELIQGGLHVRLSLQLRAEERAGLAGPPQVDQKHVTLLAQGVERPGNVQPPGDRAFARSAGEIDERIGKAVGTGRRQHHDAERDLPPGPCGPVFEHLIGAAERLRRHPPTLAGSELGPARRLRPRPGRGGPEMAENGKDGENGSLSFHGGLLLEGLRSAVYYYTSTPVM